MLYISLAMPGLCSRVEYKPDQGLCICVRDMCMRSPVCKRATRTMESLEAQRQALVIVLFVERVDQAPDADRTG